MALAVGTRLGPYEIVSPLSTGGMGEVYKARDTRLDRTIAIKVLPENIAADPAMKQRFEREAKALAALSHPHICPIFDVGQEDGVSFLVMELLLGETLADRLTKGSVPLDQALRYAIQIADALDKAHRQRILHRDLKPGNIMLTKQGAKLLDFGLAAVRPAGAGMDDVATSTSPLTGPGVILGTLPYMAPEQFEGKSADARSDIFAFGATVYEMVTGHRAFAGQSVGEVIGAIVKGEPPRMSSLQPLTPPVFEHVVSRCLAKDPDERWQTAGDLMRELAWAADIPSRTDIAPTAPSKGTTRNRVPWWSVVLVCAVAALPFGTSYFSSEPQEAPTVRVSISPPDPWKVLVGRETNSTNPLALSPDGQRLAFVARNAEGTDQLWIRSLDTLTARALPGTERVSSPFWSPDSRFIGFFADGKLKKIEISGGPPITLCDAAAFNTAGTWGRSGVILFTAAPGLGVQRVSASGGAPTVATDPGQTEFHMQPSFLPDGSHFTYAAISEDRIVRARIYVGALDSTERTLLLDAVDSTNVAYSRGHLLFLRDATTLMAQPFDARRRILTGEPFPIAEQIQIPWRCCPQPVGVFSASDNGVLAYQTASAIGSRLVWFDRSGKELSVVGDAGFYVDLEPSPDRTRAVVSVSEPGTASDVWVVDLARGIRTRLTSDPTDESRPEWSADGSRIVFSALRNGQLNLYEKASDGVGAEELLLADDVEKYPQNFSPDGRFLLYTTLSVSEGGFDLWLLPLFGDRRPLPFLKTPFNEVAPEFSPDGRWVAYQSDESGRMEIYVTTFPGPGPKWRISTDGGDQATWRPDGTEIFYFTINGNKLMAAPVDGRGTSFKVGGSRPLFETRPVMVRGRYFPSLDGQRFLINTLPEPTQAPITVVVNWMAGLRN